MKMNPDLVATLTARQAAALKEFKRRVIKEHGEDEAEDEYRLRRFLKAREFDIERAELMFRNHLIWRKKNLCDITDYKVPEVVQKYFPLSKLGFDKNGLPTVVINFGNLDIKGLLASCKRCDLVKTTLKSLEEDERCLKEKSEKEGRVLEKWNYICDFENFTFMQATHKEGIEILMHLLSIYEANYPERVNIVFAINASYYFTILFAIAKPVLSSETLNKIVIYGKDGWKEDLQKLIPLNSLPAYLGGKKTDPNGDPRCPSLINHGGIVPKSYYLPKMDRRICTEPGFKQYTIQRMSKTVINLYVDEPGSIIEWEFETENHDISFGICYCKEDSPKNKPEEIIAMQRVDTRFNCEAGVYTCSKPGIYSLVFDNTFSWFRQKQVFCRARILYPGGKRICVTN